MKVLPIKQVTCPHCGVQLDAATALAATRPVPVPGARMFCLYCVTLGVFDDDLSLRLATTVERLEAEIGSPEACLAAEFAHAEWKRSKELDENGRNTDQG